METDWNKLIERYLQNELSEEGKEAFEYELSTNPDLKMEYDLHLMIMGSAVRSAERMEIASIGKKFHFRKKLMNTAVISGGIVILSVAVYVAFHLKKADVEKPKLTQKKIEKNNEPEVQAVCGFPCDVNPVTFYINRTNVIASANDTFVEKTDSFSSQDDGVVAVVSKNGSVTKEEKKAAPETEKYWITTFEHPGVSSKSSTREDKPFYLSGNYTWSGNYMVMDTPEGLYLFDTTTNHLTIFKSGTDAGKTKYKYSETVLLGFRHRKKSKVTNDNKKVYSNKQEWGVR